VLHDGSEPGEQDSEIIRFKSRHEFFDNHPLAIF